MKKLRFVVLTLLSVLFVNASNAQYELVENVEGNVDDNVIAYQKFKHTKIFQTYCEDFIGWFGKTHILFGLKLT